MQQIITTLSFKNILSYIIICMLFNYVNIKYYVIYNIYITFKVTENRLSAGSRI